MHPALTEIVHHPKIEHSELLSVLHQFFEHSTNPLSRTARRFGDVKKGRYLDVHFKNNGTISMVDGTLSEQDTRTLAEHVRSILVKNQEQAIGQSFCFSTHDAVSGFYRYKDAFQILPIPEGAPHAPAIVADHPFILQFKYASCPDGTINGCRSMEKAAQLARILNTACNTGISTRSVFVRFFWGISSDKEFSCRWTQEGYGYKSNSPELRTLSDPRGVPAIKCYPADQYYDERFFPGDYALALPTAIDHYLDKVFSLKSGDAKAFEVASVLFSQVKEMWPRCSSAALVTTVSALEALLDREYEICKACGQRKFGLTGKFKTFLKRFVPGIVERFPTEYKALYETRSQLTHGKIVLNSDLRPWSYFGDTVQQWQDRLQRNTHRIAATALRNWVLSR